MPSYSTFSHLPNKCCTLKWPIFHVKCITVPVFNEAPNREDICGSSAHILIRGTRWKPAASFTPRPFYFRRRALCRCWVGCWLEAKAKRKHSYPCRDSQPDPSVFQPVTRYNWVRHSEMYCSIHTCRHFGNEKTIVPRGLLPGRGKLIKIGANKSVKLITFPNVVFDLPCRYCNNRLVSRDIFFSIIDCKFMDREDWRYTAATMGIIGWSLCTFTVRSIIRG